MADFIRCFPFLFRRYEECSYGTVISDGLRILSIALALLFYKYELYLALLMINGSIYLSIYLSLTRHFESLHWTIELSEPPDKQTDFIALCNSGPHTFAHIEAECPSHETAHQAAHLATAQRSHATTNKVSEQYIHLNR